MGVSAAALVHAAVSSQRLSGWLAASSGTQAGIKQHAGFQVRMHLFWSNNLVFSVFTARMWCSLHAARLSSVRYPTVRLSATSLPVMWGCAELYSTALICVISAHFPWLCTQTHTVCDYLNLLCSVGDELSSYKKPELSWIQDMFHGSSSCFWFDLFSNLWPLMTDAGPFHTDRPCQTLEA